MKTLLFYITTLLFFFAPCALQAQDDSVIAKYISDLNRRIVVQEAYIKQLKEKIYLDSIQIAKLRQNLESATKDLREAAKHLQAATEMVISLQNQAIRKSLLVYGEVNKVEKILTVSKDGIYKAKQIKRILIKVSASESDARLLRVSLFDITDSGQGHEITRDNIQLSNGFGECPFDNLSGKFKKGTYRIVIFLTEDPLCKYEFQIK